VCFTFVQRLWSGCSCRHAHETSASQCMADVTREAGQPSASGDGGFARRPPTDARSLRTAALWPQPPHAARTDSSSAIGGASVRWLRANTAAVGFRVSIGARRTVRAEESSSVLLHSEYSIRYCRQGRCCSGCKIERDLHRTFPTHALFASALGLTTLQSVLAA
jgi:hypothetical protein